MCSYVAEQHSDFDFLSIPLLSLVVAPAVLKPIKNFRLALDFVSVIDFAQIVSTHIIIFIFGIGMEWVCIKLNM